MKKIRISAVSYLNTIPFLYGIQHSGYLKNDSYELMLDYPSICAEKIKYKNADIGLIPVGAIPEILNAKIITDFCLGSCKKMPTVLLLSEVPVNEIKKIYLDYQSRTSVLLVKILANYFWKTEPLWLNTSKGFENEIKNTAAGLVIGDRTFKLAVKYPFKIDLAEEWFKFTGKSFVFACWMASLHVKKSFISNFNKALQYGIRYIDKSLALYNGFGDISTFDALNYLKNDISYSFDSEKADGMELFLKYTKALSDNTEKIC